MWPDRRIIDLFGIVHPLILSPMTGVGTVDLAASVCVAGGLGSVSCATLQPERAAQTIKQLRERTDRPINANFFCHVRAKSDTQREQAWRERLSRYYRELGIDIALPSLNGTQRQRRMTDAGMSLPEAFAAVVAETRDTYAASTAEVTR